jgi:hypothetical protein
VAATAATGIHHGINTASFLVGIILSHDAIVAKKTLT